MNGRIVRMVPGKGFGFIAGDDAHEYFFHRTTVVSPEVFAVLREGQAVTFELESSEKGLVAQNVRPR